MSCLSTTIILDKQGLLIRMKVLQSDPDGRVRTEEMDEDTLKGTALIFLYDMAFRHKESRRLSALPAKSSPLIEATRDLYQEGWWTVFPDVETTDKIIKSVKVLEDIQNDNWENDWSTSPYVKRDGSSLKEKYMPYALLEIEVTNPSLLEGFKPGDREETSLDFCAYLWLR